MYHRAGMGIIRICDVTRVERSSLAPSQQAVWDVQNRLCTERHDPGPVDGNIESAWLRPAITAFQQRMRLPQTGTIDPVTLRAMRFSTADANRIAGAVATTAIGTQGGEPQLPMAQVPWATVALAVGAAGFMLFAAHSYIKR